jgi:hypothetical protein
MVYMGQYRYKGRQGETVRSVPALGDSEGLAGGEAEAVGAVGGEGPEL